MELTYFFLGFCARVGLVAASLHLILWTAASNGYIPVTSIWLSAGVAYVLVVAWRVLIFPLYDPWRELPLVNVLDPRILIHITDEPRGAIAEQWATEYQDSDMIRLRLFPGLTNLLLLSPTAIRDVLSTHQDDWEKPLVGRNFLSRILGYGLILSEGSIHARMRKVLTSSFRIQNIRALHPLMLAKTEILLRRMEEEDGKSQEGVDICKWASKVTLDIVGNALMSKDFNALGSQRVPLNEAFERLTTANSAATMLFMLSFILPKWAITNFPTEGARQMERDCNTIVHTCERSLRGFEAQSKQGKTGDADTILASIIADPGTTHAETVEQMRTFLGAGHETTATSIAWAVHLLTLPENIEYQKRLREEIRSHPGCCTDSTTALETLPLLNAILEESLRLYPTVTNTARIAIRNTTIAGIPVAKGSLVSIFPWTVNRSRKYWGGDIATKFIPERWLDKRPDGSMIVNRSGGAESNYCNLTFWYGNRSCIGKGFAMAELRLVIAKLVSEYHVSRLPGDDGKVTPVGSVTLRPGKIFITLKKVE